MGVGGVVAETDTADFHMMHVKNKNKETMCAATKFSNKLTMPVDQTNCQCPFLFICLLK